MMRVNARFIGVAEKQVDYLAKTTGQSVSDVLRDAVDHYYKEVRGDEPRLSHFGRHVGAYRSGQADTSERYKDRVTDDLLAKHHAR